MVDHIALRGRPGPWSRRHLLLAAAATAAACAAACVLPARAQTVAPAADVPDSVTGPGCTVRFASVAAGRAVLMADDAWMLATSSFQRRAITHSDTDVAMDAFRRWNGDAVQPWSAEQRQRWLAALDTVLPAFAALHIPLPPEVLLVASNGQESANAPYTRANAVVLPGLAQVAGYDDALLLAHELWHVASRHAPALATRLYAEIGFAPMPELAFPAAWADLRLANPDAPANRHAMALTIDGRDVRVTPLLVATRSTLKPSETFFDVLQVRLVEVDTVNGAATSTAVPGADGNPRWFPVGEAYLRRLGGNTGYVIHPEETMADNIALLAMADQPRPATARPVRNPGLLVRLRAVLDAKP